MRHADKFMWFFLGMLAGVVLELVGGPILLAVGGGLFGLVWLILDGIENQDDTPGEVSDETLARLRRRLESPDPD